MATFHRLAVRPRMETSVTSRGSAARQIRRGLDQPRPARGRAFRARDHGGRALGDGSTVILSRGRNASGLVASAAVDGSTSADPSSAVSDRTRRLLLGVEERAFDTTTDGAQAAGAGGGTTLRALERADALWASIRNAEPDGNGEGPSPPGGEFVKESSDNMGVSACDFDACVCGGTLGILAAAALQARGQRVCVIERGALKGRDQEWNVSRPELMALVKLGVLTEEQADECVTIEFNPIRCGFHGNDAPSVVTRDILNAGVKPSALLARVKKNFEAAGGVVFEHAALNGIVVHPDGAWLDVKPAPGGPGGGGASSTASAEAKGERRLAGPITARLVVDCMGFASPVVRQQRRGQKPDGVCLVVGSCARGFDPEANQSADLIYTTTDIRQDYQGQYFWEAFPAGSGPTDRTTYMFTYLDAHPSRPTLASLLDDYWDLMPEYQAGIGRIPVDDVELLRVLFGYFPTYRDSPLQARWDRITQIGDASGMQSPLSFGGLGALLRHLPRLVNGIEDALLSDMLDRECLAALNAYQPALSASWLFQKCMSVAPGSRPPRDFINRLMSINFGVMESLGDDVMRPFLQDVVKFGSLGRTLVTMAVTKPLFVPQILMQAGPGPIIDWFGHFANLAAYDVLARASESGLGAAVCRALAGNAPTEELIRGEGDGEEGNGGFSWDFAVLDARQRFMLRRKMEAYKWGSGRDYDDAE